jgi:hypothetical protein
VIWTKKIKHQRAMAISMASRLLLIRLLVVLLFERADVRAWSINNHPLAVNPMSRRQSLENVLVASSTYSLVLLPFPGISEAATSNSKKKDAFLYSDTMARLKADTLQQLPTGATTTSAGVDNTLYPAFLLGTWDVTQILIGCSAPIGLAFAGGPNGIEAIGAASIAESRQRLNQPVRLELRYVQSNIATTSGSDSDAEGHGGVVEDRIFNALERLDKFAGKSVVAAVEYANTRASNRASMKAVTGRDDDPLATTVVRFKGPAAQKSFVTGHHGSVKAGFRDPSNQSSCWAGFESQRSLFALTNESTAPPITTDSELIFQYCVDSNDVNHVTGRLRIAGYLNPNSDKLYFETRNRAVTLQDYTLDMRRIW